MKKAVICLLILLCLIIGLTGCRESNNPVTLRLYSGQKPLPKSVWEDLQAYEGFELVQIVYGMQAIYKYRLERNFPITIIALTDDQILREQESLFGLAYGQPADILVPDSRGEMFPTERSRAWFTPDLAADLDLHHADAWLEGGKHFSYSEYGQRQFSLIPIGAFEIYTLNSYASNASDLVYYHDGTPRAENGEVFMGAGVIKKPFDDLPDKSLIVSAKSYFSYCEEKLSWLSPVNLYPFHYIEFSVPDPDAFIKYAKEHRLDLHAFTIEILK